MPSLTASRIIRVAARAFVAPSASPGAPAVVEGGNPVTVFLSSPPAAHSSQQLSPSIESDLARSLARSCEWESVVAHLPTSDGREQGQNPVLRFYMPSGEEVSFCAHAAIGAAAVIASEDSATTTSSSSAHSGSAGKEAKSGEEPRTINFVTGDGSTHSATVNGNEAELLMETAPTESDIDNFIALDKVRTALGLRMEDVSLGGTGLPSYVNSSVARPKTLFPMLDVNRLHSASNPKDPEEFRDLCDSIGSTGIYLYSPVTQGMVRSAEEQEEEGTKELVARYECRQFPRASGYPEDPATGIAAAALAASLRRRNVGVDGTAANTGDATHGDFNGKGGSNADPTPMMVDRYEFYQGTAMGRRSRIGIRFGEENSSNEDVDENDNEEGKKLRIYVSGLVEILSRDEEDVLEPV